MKTKKIAYLHYYLTALILGLAISLNRAIHHTQKSASSNAAIWLLDIFGVGILVISALGLLGTLMTAIQQNRIRFGVHMAVGASTSHVFRLVLMDTVLKHATLPVIFGSASSQLLLASGLLNRLDSHLFPKEFNGLHLLLCAAGSLLFLLLCALYPAIAASRIQPAEVLKGD